MKSYQHIIDTMLEELGLGEELDAWNPNPSKDHRLSTAPRGRMNKPTSAMNKPHAPCSKGTIWNSAAHKCVELRGAKRG